MERHPYDLAVFDLDGTLADPGGAITETVAEVLARHGVPRPSPDQLGSFIGPSLFTSYSRYLPEGQAREAVAMHEELFASHQHEYAPYPGIPELLQSLAKAQVSLAIATTKGTESAARIAERLDFPPFAAIQGAPQDYVLDSKAETLRAVLERIGHARAVMVGDRYLDIQAATACGIDSVGVEYGFAKEGEFEADPPTFLARSAQEVGNILLDQGT